MLCPQCGRISKGNRQRDQAFQVEQQLTDLIKAVDKGCQICIALWDKLPERDQDALRVFGEGHAYNQSKSDEQATKELTIRLPRDQTSNGERYTLEAWLTIHTMGGQRRPTHVGVVFLLFDDEGR
ncbi:MAG: hypothetical protein Q9165_002526 [Trypethelium subeluteriae]